MITLHNNPYRERNFSTCISTLHSHDLKKKIKNKENKEKLGYPTIEEVKRTLRKKKSCKQSNSKV
jgi:hypothetical protein